MEITLKFIKFIMLLPFRAISFVWKLVSSPVKLLFNKVYGPPPLMMGGPPVDHSAPDMEDDDGARMGGQTLYIMITVFVILAIVWAMTAEIDEQVRAEGVVVTPSDVQHVQSRLPGSIVDINVVLGSKVQQGDVLFRLEDEDVIANFADNEITYHAAQAAEIRLAAEASGESQIAFPKALRAKAPEAVAQEEALFLSRQLAMSSRLSILNDAIETLQRTILEKEAEQRISLEQAKLVRDEIALLEPLVKAGHEPRATLLSSKARLQQAEGSAELAGLSANARRSDLAGKIREIGAIKANFQAEAAEALVGVQTKAAQHLSRQDALQGKVEHADIKAPLSGTVSAVHVKTVGAVVQAGSVLVDIVPSEAGYFVRAQIPPANVTNVQPGQIARISLQAYDPSRFGVVMGVVERVANNTTQSEQMPPFYETMITIPKVELTKTNVPPELFAGMPVTVDILGDKRTIMSYIMTPIEKSLKTAFREK